MSYQPLSIFNFTLVALLNVIGKLNTCAPGLSPLPFGCAVV